MRKRRRGEVQMPVWSLKKRDFFRWRIAYLNRTEWRAGDAGEKDAKSSFVLRSSASVFLCESSCFAFLSRRVPQPAPGIPVPNFPGANMSAIADLDVRWPAVNAGLRTDGAGEGH
jgi:hypothetical protein